LGSAEPPKFFFSLDAFKDAGVATSSDFSVVVLLHRRSPGRAFFALLAGVFTYANAVTTFLPCFSTFAPSGCFLCALDVSILRKKCAGHTHRYFFELETYVQRQRLFGHPANNALKWKPKIIFGIVSSFMVKQKCTVTTFTTSMAR